MNTEKHNSKGFSGDATEGLNPKSVFKALLMIFGGIFIVLVIFFGYLRFDFKQKEEIFFSNVGEFINQFVRDLSSWEASSVEPYLSEKFLNHTPIAKFGPILKQLSQLGVYQSHSEPELLGCYSQSMGTPSLLCKFKTSVIWSNHGKTIELSVIQYENHDGYAVETIKFL